MTRRRLTRRERGLFGAHYAAGLTIGLAAGLGSKGDAITGVLVVATMTLYWFGSPILERQVPRIIRRYRPPPPADPAKLRAAVASGQAAIDFLDSLEHDRPLRSAP